MTPEYLEELANLADPDKLWKLGGVNMLDLSPEKRKQLDTGVALRRYAFHKRELQRVLKEGKSLIITPIQPHVTAIMSIDTPENHEILRGLHTEKP